MKPWHDFTLKLPRWVVLLIYLATWPSALLAEPIFAAETEGVRIVLYDEPCKFTQAVANLPYRATWTEKGKTYEGCFAPNRNAGVVVAYFSEDKSVAAIPMDVFRKVTGI
jgi:hypothetical protein